MRVSRHNAILNIIKKNDIENQEQLLEFLQKEGYDVTQATVSRDIKELQLVKIKNKKGKTVYVSSKEYDQPISDRFIRVFRDTILSYASAENLIIVKTLSGCGNAAGEALDCLDLEHVVGTVCGDNTMLVVVDSKENVPSILEVFDNMIKGRRND